MNYNTLKNIKHMSFDFWNTLAVPNLEFSAARTRIIAEYYGIEELDAKRIYTSVKKFADTAAELTGFGTTRANVMKLLNAQMPKDKQLGEGDLDILSGVIDDLFITFPPTIPALVVDQMVKVQERGITMNILSNTNFIQGETLLEHVIIPAFGENFFAFQMYSDEWEMAKPHNEFFNAMVRHARMAVTHANCKRDQIIHIGDNEITDVYGASEVQINSIHVNSPHHLVDVLQDLLNEPV